MRVAFIASIPIILSACGGEPSDPTPSRRDLSIAERSPGPWVEDANIENIYYYVK